MSNLYCIGFSDDRKASLFLAALAAVSGFVPPYAVGIVGGILAACAAACQIAVAWKNPNADLAANKSLAQSEIQAGVLQLLQLGDAVHVRDHHHPAGDGNPGEIERRRPIRVGVATRRDAAKLRQETLRQLA